MELSYISDVSETSSVSSDEVFAKKIVPGTNERKLKLVPNNEFTHNNKALNSLLLF